MSRVSRTDTRRRPTPHCSWIQGWQRRLPGRKSVLPEAAARRRQSLVQACQLDALRRTAVKRSAEFFHCDLQPLITIVAGEAACVEARLQALQPVLHPVAHPLPETLNSAREYIEAHLGETIRISFMCRYAGTNFRSLDRIFARELGMSPQKYVKARRLNAVRRHLLTADREQGLRVTEVALNCGFAHLGRFAVEYRRYFGESPRETLHSR